MEEIKDIFYKSKMDQDIDMKFFTEYEQAKKRIVFKLINYDKNRDLLKEIPHREYLDLQMVVRGTETFLFQAIDLGEPAIPYDKKKDVEFYTAPYHSSVVLDETNFALVFPNDLHVGNVTIEEESNVKKLVFKLKV